MRRSRVVASMRTIRWIVASVAVLAVLSLLVPTALASRGPAAPAPAVLIKVNSTVGSGYETGSSVNGSVTAVSASWIQPKVACTKLNATALFEAFIGGNTSSEPIGGTAVNCKAGVASSYAWYGFSFGAMTKISTATLPVPAGSVVKVTVTDKNGTGSVGIKVGNHSVLKFAHVTGGGTFAATGVARNIVLGVLQPLAKFGNVSFGKLFTKLPGTVDVTLNGTTSGIGTFAAVLEFTMVNSHGVKLTLPSPLASSGTSFKVKWLGYS
jgi:hypothetical protein